MTTHETCSDLLTAYIDGELDADLRRDVEGHLRVCSACRTSVRELTAVRECLSSVPHGSCDGPPPWREIQRAVMRLDTRASARRTLVRRAAVFAAMAAVALVATSNSLIERWREPETRSAEERRTDAEPNSAAGELEQFIRASGEHLTPAMSSASDHTIDVLNGAIRDVRLSLAEDPDDPSLTLYLADLERKRTAAFRSLALTVRRTS